MHETTSYKTVHKSQWKEVEVKLGKAERKHRANTALVSSLSHSLRTFLHSIIPFDNAPFSFLMEPFGESISGMRNVAAGNPDGRLFEMEDYKHRVDEMTTKVDQLEQQVNEVERFFSSIDNKQTNLAKGNSATKSKDKEKHVPGIKKLNKEASRREAAKRMQDLMRQFGTILRQITQHKWAWPFMQPVDVEGLGLQDYYEIIDKPMDFSTIKNQMEAKDGTGYKNIREICADVRLVFKNAMKYNDEKSDVHVMAKTLLEKFEEKWLLFLPKVTDEETRREQEEAEVQLAMQHAQEVAHAKMARELSNELFDLDVHLEQLREMVVKRFRKMTNEEKRKLGDALTQLPPEDLSKALDIVTQNNPNFGTTAENVELDMDAQSEATLWKLNYFVKTATETQSKNAESVAPNENLNNNNKKQRRELGDAITKTSKKKMVKKPT